MMRDDLPALIVVLLPCFLTAHMRVIGAAAPPRAAN
jgi:hypothetical protein